LNVFILGCFYHYLLIALSENKANKEKLRHPFGDHESLRPGYIQQEDHSIYGEELSFVSNGVDENEVVKLIKWMLQYKETERPTLQQILESSYYMPSNDYKIYEHCKTTGLCAIFIQQDFGEPIVVIRKLLPVKLCFYFSCFVFFSFCSESQGERQGPRKDIENFW
jgi:hypothetical protein